jgi:hypothetical protein
MRQTIVAVLLLCVFALLVLAFRPGCVPLSAADVQTFTMPIDERQDRDFYLKVFQRRHGEWYQCKTWLSRAFFF